MAPVFPFHFYSVWNAFDCRSFLLASTKSFRSKEARCLRTVQLLSKMLIAVACENIRIHEAVDWWEHEISSLVLLLLLHFQIAIKFNINEVVDYVITDLSFPCIDLCTSEFFTTFTDFGLFRKQVGVNMVNAHKEDVFC